MRSASGTRVGGGIYGSCLFLEIEFFLQQTFAHDVLEFFDEDVFRVEETDESTYHVGSFGLFVVCY